jgi:acyl-CoA hydrolase
MCGVWCEKMVRSVLTLNVSMESSKKRKKKERKPCDCRVSFSAEEDQTDRRKFKCCNCVRIVVENPFLH